MTAERKPWWANWIEDFNDPHLVVGIECRACTATITGLNPKGPEDHGPLWQNLDHDYDCDRQGVHFGRHRRGKEVEEL